MWGPGWWGVAGPVTVRGCGPAGRADPDPGHGSLAPLYHLGWARQATGSRAAALAAYEQALGLYRAVGDRGGEAATLRNIGPVYDGLGERQRALEFYGQALPIRRDVGNRAGEPPR